MRIAFKWMMTLSVGFIVIGIGLLLTGMNIEPFTLLAPTRQITPDNPRVIQLQHDNTDDIYQTVRSQIGWFGGLVAFVGVALIGLLSYDRYHDAKKSKHITP